MTATVVITRPLAQAEPLAARVRALGRTVEILPLLEISALPDQAPLRAALADLTPYALIAFVSPNAIDAAFAYIAKWPQGLRAAVVGEGSRVALLAHGVPAEAIASPADPAHSDTEHLLQVLDIGALRGARVLIVRGESGRELMADSFRTAGAEVTLLPAYRRGVPQLDAQLAERLARLLDGQNDWLITSSEALRGLAQLAEQLDGPATVAKLQQQHLIVPHARIAETAAALGCHRVTQTASGDEGLLAALQSRP
ncbi:uroporphyrinogen-III synthase [Pseudoduganella sp. RAF19]|uniref:uroporphyrinogen-III synthase n=1 Tax=Pseudoduganella sp. RAF19 TaxID=3233052 RepID=UPI003F9DEE98